MHAVCEIFFPVLKSNKNFNRDFSNLSGLKIGYIPRKKIYRAVFEKNRPIVQTFCKFILNFAVFSIFFT
jgi:hypothetical protein